MIESLRAGLEAFFAFIPQLIGAIVILLKEQVARESEIEAALMS